jgi:cobalt-zinc-cadmium efflux system protein
MSHDHNHHSHGHGCGTHGADHRALDRKLAGAAWLNAVIVVVEIVGGVLSGSVALLSDALHNLSDVLALIMAWGARVLGRRPAPDDTPSGCVGWRSWPRS